MLLISAKIGPFRSMGMVQTIAIDPEVTVFVGMNEAGKTVILKALEKSADALQQEGFDVVEDYPRKDLTTYLKKHKSEPSAVTVLTYGLDDDEVSFIIDHKVKTTGFSRSALAAIIDCPVKEARDGLSIWQSYGFSD